MIPQSRRFTAGFFTVALIWATSQAQATPVISSVDGDLQEGSTLTISGSGFGSNPVPFLYDQVQNQDSYSTLQDGEIVPEDSGPWSHNTNIYGNPIEITRSGDLRTPTSSAAYYGDVKSYLGWPRALDGKSNRKIYISWWYKPNQLVDNGGSNKFVRVWDRSDGNGTRISWTQMHMTYSSTSGNSETNWATTQPNANTWNHMEIFVDADNNRITNWLNGERKHNVTDFQKANTSEGLNVGLVGFDPSIASNYPNYTFRMDDIYVSPTLARVELSDSPTWDLANRREPLNVTSWSDSKIAADLNLLSFGSSDGLFVYVVDQNGVANKEGFPLLCEKCPSKPESVTIE